VTGGERQTSLFEYGYFDDPEGLGYRGYREDGSSADIASFCAKLGVRTALDIGCAKGFLVAALNAQGIKAKGYDISDYALGFADPSTCRKHDVRGGVPDQAEAIFALGLLLYLTEEELGPVLSALRQASQRFLFFSMYYAGDLQEVPDPQRKITQSREWWRQVLERAGFQFRSEERHFDVYEIR
jgi:hypothetical protein